MHRFRLKSITNWNENKSHDLRKRSCDICVWSRLIWVTIWLIVYDHLSFKKSFYSQNFFRPFPAMFHFHLSESVITQLTKDLPSAFYWLTEKNVFTFHTYANPPTPDLQACLVHTTETIRVRYFMDRLLEHRRPVMLVGSAGTGKSVLVGDKLGSLDSEKYMIKNVPFNYYTTSAMLQGRNCLQQATLLHLEYLSMSCVLCSRHS